MSKHTPGPWEFVGDADDFECRVRQKSSVKKGPGFISEVTICENIGDTQNARLIAAAPDLLKALIDFLDDPMGDPEPCRKAIAKALGKSS